MKTAGRDTLRKVSIPLRKFRKRLRGRHRCHRRLVSIPLRKFRKDAPILRVGRLLVVSIPLRKFRKVVLAGGIGFAVGRFHPSKEV